MGLERLRKYLFYSVGFAGGGLYLTGAGASPGGISPHSEVLLVQVSSLKQFNEVDIVIWGWQRQNHCLTYIHASNCLPKLCL